MNKIQDLTIKNQAPPPLSRSLEKALAKLGGNNKFGQPNLRFVWGQGMLRFAYGKMRMKYLYAVAKLEQKDMNMDSGIIEVRIEDYDIGIPLWFVEEFWNPELVMPKWEANRWEWHRGQKIDVLGDPPIRGMYRELWRIKGENEEDLLLLRPGKKNPYVYKHPDKDDLERIEEVLWRKKNAPQLHSADEMSPEFLIQREIKNTYEAIAAAERKKAAETKERIKSSLAPHIHRLMTSRPNAAGGGSRSFPTNANKRRGQAKQTDHINLTDADLKNTYIVESKADQTENLIIP